MTRERHQREPDGGDGEGGAERDAAADPVEQRPRGRADDDPDDAHQRDDEPGRPEAEAAHVVQVEKEERERDPRPEEVDERPELERPDCARQLRIEALEVRAEAVHGP